MANQAKIITNVGQYPGNSGVAVVYAVQDTVTGIFHFAWFELQSDGSTVKLKYYTKSSVKAAAAVGALGLDTRFNYDTFQDAALPPICDANGFITDITNNSFNGAVCPRVVGNSALTYATVKPTGITDPFTILPAIGSVATGTGTVSGSDTVTNEDLYRMIRKIQDDKTKTTTGVQLFGSGTVGEFFNQYWWAVAIGLLLFGKKIAKALGIKL